MMFRKKAFKPYLSQVARDSSAFCDAVLYRSKQPMMDGQ